jgi:hypothetical protein
LLNVNYRAILPVLELDKKMNALSMINTIYLDNPLSEVIVKHFCLGESRREELFASILINGTITFNDKHGANGYAPLHVHADDGYIHKTTACRAYTLQDFLNI